MTSPLVGAWEAAWDTHQGLVIFTETHVVELIMAKNRELFKNENEPTEAEEAAAFRTLNGSAGTYSISGSIITADREISRIPNQAGKRVQYEFSIEDDILTTKSRSGDTYVFRRVG